VKQSILKHIVVAFGIFAFVAMMTPSAAASCLDMGGVKAAEWLHPITAQQNDEPNLYEKGRGATAGIAGFWQIEFVAKGNAGIPDGSVIDSGYTTWHSDGTELLNSGRPPLTGSFCMGAWKQTGKFTYKLNHFALSWDASGNNLVGPGNIREYVTLDRNGNRFTGTITIDQYDTQGNVLDHVAGTVLARRITAD
jgi:hypothetical protein